MSVDSAKKAAPLRVICSRQAQLFLHQNHDQYMIPVQKPFSHRACIYVSIVKWFRKCYTYSVLPYSSRGIRAVTAIPSAVYSSEISFP